MSSTVSLIGIFAGLGMLMYLAYKGHSVIWVAPACAILVAAFSGLNILDAYRVEYINGVADYIVSWFPAFFLGAVYGKIMDSTGAARSLANLNILDAYRVEYINGVADYIVSWFPAFFLGAVYGKIMDSTGAARSLANKIVSLIGSKFAVATVVIPCLLMTYGGISLFVVVFVIYPMGYAIYREANLPRTLLPGAIAFGAFGITMTAVPGSPQIQNLIPTEYYGTTATAAPLMSILAILMIGIPGYMYLEWRVRQVRKKGLGFVEDSKHVDTGFDESTLSSWHWLSGLLPLIVVVLILNFLPNILKNAGIADWSASQAVVVALAGGILVACAMNIQQYKILLPAVSNGANGSLTAIMNTACAVGFGSVVKVVSGFAVLKGAMLNMPGSILLSEAVAVNVLAGATGSASGGMSIALEALAPQYLEKATQLGLNPEYLHRIASLSSGGLDTLPHNGAVLTLLAVSNCTHKESYFDIFITSCLIPVIVSLLLAFIWGFMG